MKIDEIYEPSNFIDILLFHIDKYPEMLKYMEDCVKSNTVLHHNSGSLDTDFIVVTEDHKSPQEGAHNYFGNYLDDFFNENYGINFRKDAIYTTLNGSSSYGSPFILLPTGNYKMCYSEEIYDWYMTWRKEIIDIVMHRIDTKYDENKVADIVFKVLESNEKSISEISNDLYRAFIKKGFSKEDSKDLTKSIFDEIKKQITKLLSTYEVADNMGELPTSLSKTNNEIMVVSKSYLLLNKKKIIAKSRKTPIELFQNVINRYNDGERF
jgi:IS1 family transposase